MSESYVPPPFAPAPGRYLPAAAGPSPYPAFAPKTIGQILDRTYRLMRSHFWLLVGIAAIPSLLDAMERHGHIQLDTEVRRRLLAIGNK